MYLSIYGLSFLSSVFYLFVLSCVWYGGKELLCRSVPGQRCWRWLCFAVLLLWALIVLQATLFSRAPSVQAPIWLPFQQLCRLLHGGNREILRMLWMNMLLFVPAGMLLPELLPAKWDSRRNLVLTALAALLFSFGIEFSQWYWQLGQAETDDVIANTLGALLGYGISVLGNRIILQKKDVS